MFFALAIYLPWKSFRMCLYQSAAPHLAWTAKEGQSGGSVGIRDFAYLLLCRMATPRRRLRISQIRLPLKVKVQKG